LGRGAAVGATLSLTVKFFVAVPGFEQLSVVRNVTVMVWLQFPVGCV